MREVGNWPVRFELVLEIGTYTTVRCGASGCVSSIIARIKPALAQQDLLCTRRNASVSITTVSSGILTLSSSSWFSHPFRCPARERLQISLVHSLVPFHSFNCLGRTIAPPTTSSSTTHQLHHSLNCLFTYQPTFPLTHTTRRWRKSIRPSLSTRWTNRTSSTSSSRPRWCGTKTGTPCHWQMTSSGRFGVRPCYAAVSSLWVRWTWVWSHARTASHQRLILVARRRRPIRSSSCAPRRCAQGRARPWSSAPGGHHRRPGTSAREPNKPSPSDTRGLCRGPRLGEYGKRCRRCCATPGMWHWRWLLSRPWLYSMLSEAWWASHDGCWLYI